ncbi:hypothetical protein YTPLAS72_35150 [Nitrospira sp.]|nr:hypothetical protein YTPLAS72_35150 [Nitrospira sp.]
MGRTSGSRLDRQTFESRLDRAWLLAVARGSPNDVGSCTLCIQACPTKAITEPYVVDATRCISYLTIELRGEAAAIPQDLQSGMGNKIFGCDDCLDVCPFNLRSEPTHEETFQPTDLTLAPDLNTLSELDESTFSRWFQHSPIRRAKLHGLHRNVAIARHNTSSS